MSTNPQGGRRPDNIAAAIADVSERASLLVREEIELAKAEVTEKVTKLVKGAVVGVAAGVFFLTALFFVLIGCAWLLYWVLPVGDFAYFWGFFAMAAILIVLGVVAGLIAAKVVKRGAPPVPSMAIEEAQKIRQAVSTSPYAGTTPPYSPPPATEAPVAPPPPPPPSSPPPVSPPASDPAAYTPPPIASEPPVPEPPAAAYEPAAPEALAPEPAAEPPSPEAAAEPITDEHRAVPPPAPRPEGGGLAADAIFNKPRGEGD